MAAPDPTNTYPLEGYRKLCFLNQLVDHPQIEIGDYTYYDDHEDVGNFLRNVRYLFDFTGDRLRIGRFCMIASGVSFLLNGGNHLADALTAFPFAIFGEDWADAMAGKAYPNKGDTVVGNDVWLGHRATILPGVTIGHGAIVGTAAVVTRDVAPYTVVGGNPARPLRQRFDDATVARLLEVAWWDWPVERITRNVRALTGGDVGALID